METRMAGKRQRLKVFSYCYLQLVAQWASSWKTGRFDRCPESNKKPLGQSTILYDYSEEELMASIEREYCR
ncbi:hypothetical protein DV515_00000712 [Chloebia gouldiae]|uniref:Uncharacterized protein n=1 Tax=Chloebia gouldiae TaxID=44316 RepID=A0A3L8T8I0_CHLGU|nr:hypothetical protein DV515_00000712 [Chloebia gouldiae]